MRERLGKERNFEEYYAIFTNNAIAYNIYSKYSVLNIQYF